MCTVLVAGLESLETETSKVVARTRHEYRANGQVPGPFSPESARRFREVGLAGAGSAEGALFEEAYRKLDPAQEDGVYRSYKRRMSLRSAQVARAKSQADVARMDAVRAAAAAAASARGKGLGAAGVHADTHLSLAEKAAGRQASPRNESGRRICLEYLCHHGCPGGAGCDKGVHEEPSQEGWGLSPAGQLLAAVQGGLRSAAPIPPHKLADRLRALRRDAVRKRLPGKPVEGASTAPPLAHVARGASEVGGSRGASPRGTRTGVPASLRADAGQWPPAAQRGSESGAGAPPLKRERGALIPPELQNAAHI